MKYSFPLELKNYNNIKFTNLFLIKYKYIIINFVYSDKR